MPQRRVRDEHVQRVQGGAEHVTYRGLLAMAHDEFSRWTMEVKVLQFASGENENTTVCEATVTVMDDEGSVLGRYTEIGDANPANVSRNIAPSAPRMAATRAKGRALRDALNIGEVMREELPGDAPQQAPRKPQKATRSQIQRITELATELAGGDEGAGVAKVEERAGSSLSELDRDDADGWVARLERQREKTQGETS